MNDLVFDMSEFENEDSTTDWAALFGVDPEDMVEPTVGPVKIPVQQKPNEMITFGEYGEALRGIRSMQIVKHPMDPVWYQVDYVIESMSNIGGTLEVLDVRKMVDEFGMSAWATEPVQSWEFNAAEKELKKMFAQMGGIGRY